MAKACSLSTLMVAFTFFKSTFLPSKSSWLQQLGTKISHGIILENCSLAVFETFCSIINGSKRSLHDFIQNILCKKTVQT